MEGDPVDDISSTEGCAANKISISFFFYYYLFHMRMYISTSRKALVHVVPVERTVNKQTKKNMPGLVRGLVWVCRLGQVHGHSLVVFQHQKSIKVSLDSRRCTFLQ